MVYINNYGQICCDDYLAHHGILGMKWGVRHDHYPLDASEHTSAEKKAGWKDSLDSGSPALNKKQEKELSKYKKKQLKQIHRQYDRRIQMNDMIAEAQQEHADKKKNKKQDDILDEFKHRSLVERELRDKEIDAVMKMTYDDMKSEKQLKKKLVGKEIADSLIGFETKGTIRRSIASNVTGLDVRGTIHDAKMSKRVYGDSGKKFDKTEYSMQRYRDTHNGRDSEVLKKYDRWNKINDTTSGAKRGLHNAGRIAEIAGAGNLAKGLRVAENAADTIKSGAHTASRLSKRRLFGYFG